MTYLKKYVKKDPAARKINLQAGLLILTKRLALGGYRDLSGMKTRGD